MESLLPELLGEIIQLLALREFEALRLTCKRFAALRLASYWKMRYSYLYGLSPESGAARHRELLALELEKCKTLIDFLDIIHEIGGLPTAVSTEIKYLHKLLNILHANKIYSATIRYEPNYVYVAFHDEVITINVNHLGVVDFRIGYLNIRDYYRTIYLFSPNKDATMFNILAALVM